MESAVPGDAAGRKSVRRRSSRKAVPPSCVFWRLFMRGKTIQTVGRPGDKMSGVTPGRMKRQNRQSVGCCRRPVSARGFAIFPKSGVAALHHPRKTGERCRTSICNAPLFALEGTDQKKFRQGSETTLRLGTAAQGVAARGNVGKAEAHARSSRAMVRVSMPLTRSTRAIHSWGRAAAPE